MTNHTAFDEIAEYVNITMTDPDRLKLQQLVNQKLTWLTQAHTENICQKIVAVTRAFGKQVYYRFREHEPAYDIEIGEVLLHSAVSIGSHIPGTHDRFNQHIKVWGTVKGTKKRVVHLEYIDDHPNFPISGGLFVFGESVEDTPYIFIPGKWVNELDEQYLKATEIETHKSINAVRARTSALAERLFICPKVEV